MFAFGDSSVDGSSRAGDSAVALRVTHVRHFDRAQKANFYVESKTKRTVWDIPSHGIVQCTTKDGKVFFTDARSKKSGWSLDELAAVLLEVA